MPAESRATRHLAIELVQVDLDRGGRAVLRDIDWKIAPGERWLLFGANGAGKTQLLKLLAGAVWPKPTGRGQRRYRLGREWQNTPQDALAEIAYLGPERQDRYHRYGWNATVEHVQRAHQQAAKTPAPAAKKPASMGIVNQAPRAGSDGDIVSAFGEMKRRLGAENKRIDEEIARLKKSREDAATQTRDRVRQWLIEHDPDVRSPVTQSVLDQEKAFLQQVGFTVKGYVEERTKKAK